MITQHDEMARMNPKSVNTIRIVSVQGKVFAAVLRVGKGDSEIDNLSAGGIACPMDIETGIITGKGRDYLGNEYVMHPLTDVVFPGFKIPNWDKAMELVENTSKAITGIPVIGFDIAITKNGAAIVEINEGTEIEVLQVPFKKGFRFLWKDVN